MATKTTPEGIRNTRLIQIIMTNQPGPDGLSKMRALTALRQSRSTKKVEVFSSILANRQEQRRFKHMAARGLYELGGQRAEQALTENARNVDEYTAATFAQALGRIGSERSVSVMSELQTVALPAAKARAAFATSLLAYRHHLEGHEVEAPRDDQLMELPADSEAIDMKVAKAGEDEATLAMAALKQEPVDVSLTVENAQQIICGPNNFVLLWNREFAGQQLRRLQERKGVVGLLFRRSRFEDAYALSSFVLGTPDGERLKVSLHRSSNGDMMYAGWVELSGAEARFDIQAVKRPGASAIKFTGSISNGQLAMDAARVATRVQSRREPIRASDMPLPE